jgi:hypothetical protein
MGERGRSVCESRARWLETARAWCFSMVASARRSFSWVMSDSIFRSDSSSRSRCVSMRRASRSRSPIFISSSSMTSRSMATLYLVSMSSSDDVWLRVWRSKSSFCTSTSRSCRCRVRWASRRVVISFCSRFCALLASALLCLYLVCGAGQLGALRCAALRSDARGHRSGACIALLCALWRTHLPLLRLEADALDLLLQLALALLALLHVALQLGLELLAGRLELLQLGLQRLVRRLVVVQLLLQAAEPVAPPLGRRGRFRSYHGGRTAGVVGRNARSGSRGSSRWFRGDCAVLGWAGCPCGGEAGDPCVAGGEYRRRVVGAPSLALHCTAREGSQTCDVG